MVNVANLKVSRFDKQPYGPLHSQVIFDLPVASFNRQVDNTYAC